MNLHNLLDPNFLQHNINIRRFVIVALYALLAKAVDLFISRVLSRLARLSKMEMDDKIIDAIHSPVYWSVFCLGVLNALAIEPIPSPWQHVLPNLTKSFILLIWTIAGFKIIHMAFQQSTVESILRRNIPATAFNIIKKLLRIIILALAAIWLLGLWNVNLTPFFASAGIAGIAVAMAAKDSLANFFGGLSIFMDNIFKEGDFIVLDSGERGEVMDVGMRSTRIMTRDDILITIPNSILANTKVINESAPIPRFRIKIPVGVAYGNDPEAVEKVLISVADNNRLVSKDPVPRVRFRQLGQSSIDFELLCWTDDPRNKGLVSHELLKEIYVGLGKANIAIPFPQMDVHLIQ